MKLPDSGRLRLPLFAGAISLVGSAVLVYWSHAERLAAETMLHQQRARLAQTHARHQEALETDATTRRTLHQLNTRAAPVFSPRQTAMPGKLHAGSQEQLQTGKAGLEISPLKPYSRTEPDTSPTALVATTLRLRGEVAHEGQLLAFLEHPTRTPFRPISAPSLP
ncbi:MAG: hypothetical protein IPQ01_11495 [Zoogloea sp.]|nr:hypothetical protein [Zoogloea sp.]